MSLSPKQEAFCREYVVDHNGTQAAIRAGYAQNSANEQAARMLVKDSIKSRIAELDIKLADKVEVTAEMVLRQYVKIAFTEASDIIDPKTGNLKTDKDGKYICGDIITGITVSNTAQGTKRSFKLASKDKALEMLARVTGLVKLDGGEGDATGGLVQAFTEAIAAMQKASNRK